MIPFERPDPSTPGHAPVSRAALAELLRRVRAAPETERGTTIADAHAAAPGRRTTRRLEIDRRLGAGDTNAAWPLIAEGLLERPTDPQLTLRRAECLLRQGRLRRAEMEIRLVLSRRPLHLRTLVIAACVHRALGRFPEAAEALQRALTLRPERDDIRAILVDTYVEAECLAQADTTLNSMRRPSPVLHARILRRQGHTEQALALLEASLRRPVPGTRTVAVVGALIDLLEATGDFPRLRRVLDDLDDADPTTVVRAGRAWLRLGAFETAIERIGPLAASRRHASEALAVLTVAASLADRPVLAERALSALRSCPEALDRAATADLWCRGLVARLVRDEESRTGIGALEESSVLRPLLRAAADVFTPAPAVLAEPKDLAPDDVAETARHRAACLRALGRRPEASEEPLPFAAPHEVTPSRRAA